ncbi:hypothetical protein ACFU5O_17500 [Streptomyces sp. NPDC057445]
MTALPPVGGRTTAREAADRRPGVPYGTDAVIPSGPAKGFTIDAAITRT